jgi:hypothetical protein
MEVEKMEGKVKLYSGIIWAVLVAIYLIVSFLTDAWSVTWIILVLGVVVQRVISLLSQLKEQKR